MTDPATWWRIEPSIKGTAFVVVRNPKPGFAQYINASGKPSGKASKFRTIEAARLALAAHSVTNQDASKVPTVTMLPRDQLAERLELQRAIELVKAAGYDLVPRETLGCEGAA